MYAWKIMYILVRCSVRLYGSQVKRSSWSHAWNAQSSLFTIFLKVESALFENIWQFLTFKDICIFKFRTNLMRFKIFVNTTLFLCKYSISLIKILNIFNFCFQIYFAVSSIGFDNFAVEGMWCEWDVSAKRLDLSLGRRQRRMSKNMPSSDCRTPELCV